jgi:DNA adenine methylase
MMIGTQANNLIQVERPVLRYHGGKWKLAEWIIGFFPPHDTYVEAFGGGASVLLRKPRSHGEVYNDLDSEIVNVFRVLRGVEQGKELERLLRLTPYSREEHRMSYEPTADLVELARRTILRSFQGFSSASVTKVHKTGFRANASRNGTTPARDWSHYPEHISSFIERMQGVVIENRDANEVIDQHASIDTLFYVDPPYPFSTRYAGAAWKDCYRHEMSDDDHRRLAETLHGVKGMVVLSGYPCALYDDLFGNWKRVEREAYADGARRRTECLWLNPLAVERSSQQSLFTEVVA